MRVSHLHRWLGHRAPVIQQKLILFDTVDQMVHEFLRGEASSPTSRNAARRRSVFSKDVRRPCDAPRQAPVRKKGALGAVTVNARPSARGKGSLGPACQLRFGLVRHLRGYELFK